MSTTQSTSPQAGIVVSTAITAGGAADDCPIGTCNPTQNNHVEGVVVSTAITAGAADCPTGTCNDQNNHAEGLVLR